MVSFLVVFNIVLGLFVIGLCAMVLALARQVGVLYERVAPAGALMLNNTLQPGSIAPVVEVEDINSGQHRQIGGQLDRAQLLFFLSPNCPVCKTLLPMVKSVQSAEQDWLDIVFASDGDIQEHREFVAGAGLDRDSYVLSERLGKEYGVSKLPFAVLIRREGVVASLGLVNSREHFESLFESMETGIPSVQAFLQGTEFDDALIASKA